MYDFDTLIDRTGTGAVKWDRRTPEEIDKNYLALSVADMELPTAPAVVEAVVTAAKKGVYGYTDPDEAYFDAVAGWMKRRHDFQVKREELVCTGGVVPAIATAVRAFTDVGDGVIIQPPVYYPFSASIHRNGRVVLENPLKQVNGVYEMDFDDLERKAAQPSAKILLLCSPHNPVGRVWTKEELMRVGEICLKNGVLILSDEIHFDMVFEGKHTVFSNLSEPISQSSIICTALSKSFNIAGLQLSNIFIKNGSLRRRFLRQLHTDGYSNISYFGYCATIAAYNDGEDWFEAVLGYIKGNVEVFRTFLQEHFPQILMTQTQGTYLAWTDWRSLGLSNEELEHFMRREAGLILDEGYIFGTGGDGFERFNLALPREELRRALKRLCEAGKARGFAKE